MKRNPGILMIVLLLPLFSLSQSTKKSSFEVSGNIRGLKNDSVVLFITNYAYDGKRISSDTLIAKASNDRFSLISAIQQPKFVWVQFGGFRSRRSASFFLEKGKIRVEGDIDSLDDLSVTGTPSNNEMTGSRRVTNNIYKRIKQQREQLKTLNEGSDEYKKLYNTIAVKFDSINEYEVNYIRTHPASQMSGIYLYVKQDKVPVDELERLYNSLTPEARQNDMVLMIPSKIKAKRSVAVGNQAPDFTTRDTSGQTVRLSDFKGKYVLLEFWASWCVPCRQQSPHLIQLYNKYADKGFTILQYSVDDNNAAAKWKDAIRKDGLQWTQTSDLGGLESKVSKLYGVQPIPDNFLIDRNGIILARGLEGSELDEKLNKLLNR